MSYELRSLQEHELPAWFDHVASVFDRTGRAYFMDHWFHDPWRSLSGILTAWHQGRIVSTVRVFDRRIYLGGAEVTMGGIGEVSTAIEHRRRGLSGRLLVESITLMESRQTALSMLFSGQHAHYGRFGWHVVPQLAVQLSGLPVPLPGAAVVAVRPVEYAADVERMAELYACTSATLAGPVVRSPEYWWNWLRGALSSCLVAEQDGRLVAYLYIRRQQQSLSVEEYAAAPGCAAALIALLNHALTTMPAAAGGEAGAIPSQQVLEGLGLRVPKALADLLCLHELAGQAEAVTSNSTMVRLIDLLSLARQMQPVWQERLRAAGWEGRVGLACGAQACLLACTDGKLNVEPMPADVAQLRLEDASFLRLLFGAVDPAAVEIEGDAGPEGRRLLQALFPPVHYVFWRADGF